MGGELVREGVYLNSTDNLPDHFAMKYTLLPLIFVMVFAILMPILFVNLLIGLAVGDIEQVLQSASLKRLGMQVAYHTELEQRWLPLCVLHRVDKSYLIEHPNWPKCSSSKLINWFMSAFGCAGVSQKSGGSAAAGGDKIAKNASPGNKKDEFESDADKIVTVGRYAYLSKNKKNNTHGHLNADIGGYVTTSQLDGVVNRLSTLESVCSKQLELTNLIISKMEIHTEADEQIVDLDEGDYCSRLSLDANVGYGGKKLFEEPD